VIKTGICEKYYPDFGQIISQNQKPGIKGNLKRGEYGIRTVGMFYDQRRRWPRASSQIEKETNEHPPAMHRALDECSH
jgi:hypothetical protein